MGLKPPSESLRQLSTRPHLLTTCLLCRIISPIPDAGRDWGQEEEGTTEDEMAGWHHWLDGHKSEWTPGAGDGQGGLVCCDSWGRKESDTTVTELNWTDKAKVDVFLELSCFFNDPTDVGNLISCSSVFLNPAQTSGRSWFMYYWSLAWRILSITLLVCEVSAFVW